MERLVFLIQDGCDIGARPIDLHLQNFARIGIKINENSRYIECKCDKIESKNIDLDFPSVGATENLILASILGDHEITINNAAKEPEIIDLSNFKQLYLADLINLDFNSKIVIHMDILVLFKILQRNKNIDEINQL